MKWLKADVYNNSALRDLKAINTERSIRRIGDLANRYASSGKAFNFEIAQTYAICIYTNNKQIKIMILIITIIIINIMNNHSLVGVRSLEFTHNHSSRSHPCSISEAPSAAQLRLVSFRSFATPLCLALDYLGDQKCWVICRVTPPISEKRVTTCNIM